ncbi:hypothetical protein SeMB42_g01469 [Synchytrium endobioticum]|uniref:FAR1 domain-containing protein n=1 Tax=Synchytrium endobioticum TaxID=286115 RepID=A0A507DL39_9FUNG|nr:hypothetical protein SeLEV6574_g01203 [Synchytrium endobioticum]TPX52343.1 hypothetical protein SeMB42_g01469 [Synchytrium endobioticum]
MPTPALLHDPETSLTRSGPPLTAPTIPSLPEAARVDRRRSSVFDVSMFFASYADSQAATPLGFFNSNYPPSATTPTSGGNQSSAHSSSANASNATSATTSDLAVTIPLPTIVSPPAGTSIRQGNGQFTMNNVGVIADNRSSSFDSYPVISDAVTLMEPVVYYDGAGADINMHFFTPPQPQYDYPDHPQSHRPSTLFDQFSSLHINNSQPQASVEYVFDPPAPPFGHPHNPYHQQMEYLPATTNPAFLTTLPSGFQVVNLDTQYTLPHHHSATPLPQSEFSSSASSITGTPFITDDDEEDDDEDDEYHPSGMMKRKVTTGRPRARTMPSRTTRPFARASPIARPRCASSSSPSVVPQPLRSGGPSPLTRQLTDCFSDKISSDVPFDDRNAAIKYAKNIALESGFAINIRTSRQSYIVLVCEMRDRVNNGNNELETDRNGNKKKKTTGCGMHVILYEDKAENCWRFRTSKSMEHNHELPLRR